MDKTQRRSFAFFTVIGASVLGACSVDTSDLHFVPDDVLTQLPGAGGDPDPGGVVNGAGTKSEAGSSSGGTSAGGSVATGGKASAGSNTGGTATAGSTTGGAPMGGMPAGGMPAGGSGGALVCRPAKGNPAEPLIDDFDDGNPMLPMKGGREGGWYISNDGSGSQMPSADPTRPPIPDMPGFTGMGYALHTQGSGFMVWGADFGVTLLNVGGRLPCPYDVSPHQGVRFYIKGMISDGTLHFTMPTTQTSPVSAGGTCQAPRVCGDHYAFDVNPVPTVWTRISIPFSSLKQGNSGSMYPLDLTQVLNLEFGVHAKTQFDYWIDQVEFY